MNDSTRPDGFPLTRAGRWLAGLWSLILIGGFGLAAWLQPDARGFGTHQQLGLPPCSFEPFLGVPCPSCGMTTSFSHFIRGQWLSALRANVTGTLLALLCAVQIPWLAVSIRRRCLWKIHRPDLALLILLGGLYLVALSDWLFRFFTR